MKKTLKLVTFGAAALLITACSDVTRINEQEDGRLRNAQIEFGNYVSRLTRASKTGTNFVAGESMAVWGFQTTGTETDKVFDNQQVTYVSGTEWTYTNKKLWNIGSSYMFYGVFPYSTTLYSMSNENLVSFANYTNPTATASQIDLMVSERRAVSPFNTVEMIFHHIMSNVNISVKIADGFDVSGITSVTLDKLSISGIENTGSYTQTGWTSTDAPVGAWSGQSGDMAIADFTNIALNTDKSAVSILEDCIMIPQTLFTTDGANDVTVDAVFKVRYTDGTSSTFSRKAVRLAGITGKDKNNADKIISSWDINSRYNYILSFNPAYSTRVWDADGDGSIIVDPITGTTETDNDDPTPGTMKYDPEKPNIISVLDEDTDGDGIPDKWNDYPIVWEDIDNDGLLEAGIDKDGDGQIDNVDNDNNTQQVPGGDPDKDPSDGNPNNPDGKDCILVYVDTDGDNIPDDWRQLQKDPDTGIIEPEREVESATIEFTATVSDWDDYSVNYNIK